MTTYSFDQLDERAQGNAVTLCRDELWQRDFGDTPREIMPYGDLTHHKHVHAGVCLSNEGWRFTEHGERVA